MPQNEAEWKQAATDVTRSMRDFTKPFVTPLSKVLSPEEGELLGTGGYITALGKIMLITNDHNFEKLDINQIGAQFFGNDHVFMLHHITYSTKYPFDVGFTLINPAVWNLPKLQPHNAVAIPQTKLAPAHKPVENELLFLKGYALQESKFLFNTLMSNATSYTGKEVPLPERWEHPFHFAIDYRPDLAEELDPGYSLPRPDGLSGSLVWNTHYVECASQGFEWQPEFAEVTGIVWGWPSGGACLIATRIEYVRSYLAHALDDMAARGEITVT
ncbi:hypothetical protein FV242_16555 [Methylobacterium sp. WL64]|uniref:hypothetical protein n=1 Tax=Methylobacterium sp. WL64 TaxID=2603894 RepID=UPI0011C7CF39|nr:hypothetical protein [Methylobacterium sp. WL64]TXN01984.1 hypothetical protein FV242_16555 [Methylobacterium sp. WL64]